MTYIKVLHSAALSDCRSPCSAATHKQPASAYTASSATEPNPRTTARLHGRPALRRTVATPITTIQHKLNNTGCASGFTIVRCAAAPLLLINILHHKSPQIKPQRGCASRDHLKSNIRAGVPSSHRTINSTKKQCLSHFALHALQAWCEINGSKLSGLDQNTTTTFPLSSRGTAISADSASATEVKSPLSSAAA